MVYAMDALFGLPRKKSAGTSYQDPLHGNLFFCNQSAVDQFVTDIQQPKPTSNVSIVFMSLFGFIVTEILCRIVAIFWLGMFFAVPVVTKPLMKLQFLATLVATSFLGNF